MRKHVMCQQMRIFSTFAHALQRVKLATNFTYFANFVIFAWAGQMVDRSLGNFNETIAIQ